MTNLEHVVLWMAVINVWLVFSVLTLHNKVMTHDRDYKELLTLVDDLIKLIGKTIKPPK